MRCSRTFLCALGIGLSLSLVSAHSFAAIADNSRPEYIPPIAEQQLTVDDFAIRAYTDTTRKMFVARLSAEGIELSASTTDKLYSFDSAVHEEAQNEILNLMTARFGQSATARLVIFVVESAKELSDGLEKFRRTSTRPRSDHTNRLIDRIRVRAGSSDLSNNVLDHLIGEPRRKIQTFVDDLGRFLHDGTRSSDDLTNSFFDAVIEHAEASRVTLRQLAENLNRNSV
jgi:hypothetical protein